MSIYEQEVWSTGLLDSGSNTAAANGIFVLSEGHNFCQGVLQGGGVEKIGGLGLEEEDSACWCLWQTTSQYNNP
jgi:hypothetical protein